MDFIIDIWNDFKAWAEGIWNDFTEFFADLPVDIFEALLDGVALVLETIPVPAFITQDLGFYLNGIDPGILYFVQRSGFANAIALLGAGLSFRLLRKLVTLGQW